MSEASGDTSRHPGRLTIYRRRGLALAAVGLVVFFGGGNKVVSAIGNVLSSDEPSAPLDAKDYATAEHDKGPGPNDKLLGRVAVGDHPTIADAMKGVDGSHPASRLQRIADEVSNETDAPYRPETEIVIWNDGDLANRYNVGRIILAKPATETE